MNNIASKNDSTTRETTDHTSQWRELRELLTGPERRQLTEILTRLNDPVCRAEELSQALPDAITLSRTRSDRMTNALGPSIDEALKAAVRKDPKSIADAIFPALGPAIRKSIGATLMGMIQSLNQLLNQSLTLQGFKWRLEALRTHRSFGEVVLLHTLVYRVEQIFLIHRHTGVVLQHVASSDALVRDPDLVSGMLTAIQDFVKDAFRSQDGEMLDTLRMDGDHSVWIEQGPQALLAVVLRGTPPLSLRERFQDMLADIHRTFRSKLSAFDGQIAPFAMIQPQLESALTTETRNTKQRLSPTFWIVVAALIALILFGLWRVYDQERHWRHFLALLEAQSGIVVTKAGQGWGRFSVEGLRDPLAGSPQRLALQAGLDPKTIKSSWKPYQSLDSALVLQRARQQLQPPEGVTVQLRNGVLVAAGHARHDWVEKLRRLAPAMAGVTALDDHQLHDIQMMKITDLAAQLSRERIGFALESSAMESDQQSRLRKVAGQITALRSIGQEYGIPIRVVIVGQSDPTGPEMLNMELSRKRALRVMRYLIEQGLDPTMFSAVGRGSNIPSLQSTPALPLESERRVSFHTFVDGIEIGS